MNPALVTTLGEAIEKLRQLSQQPNVDPLGFKNQLKVVETLAEGLFPSQVEPTLSNVSNAGAFQQVGKSAPDWVADNSPPCDPYDINKIDELLL